MRAVRLSDFAVEQARSADLFEVVRQKTDLYSLTSSKADLWGICPFCGGGKSTACFHVTHVGYKCFSCGAGGRDAIKFLMECEGIDFASAVRALVGELNLDPEEAARRAEQLKKEREAREQIRAQQLEHKRLKEEARARELWRRGVPAEKGGMVARYLEGRGVDPDLVHLESFRDLYPAEYYAGEKLPRCVASAMLTPFVMGDERFLRGVHMTYFDEQAKKLIITDETTGEKLPSKKVRGSFKGSAMRLSPPKDNALLLLGEGIETCLSLFCALGGRGAVCQGMPVVVWAASSLDNLSGGLLTGTRDFDPAEPGVMPPKWARLVLLIGDGDSDPIKTRVKLRAAQQRHKAAGFDTRVIMAPEGQDFNDMWRDFLKVMEGARDVVA